MYNDIFPKLMQGWHAEKHYPTVNLVNHELFLGDIHNRPLVQIEFFTLNQ